jgi:hypothetical protein
MIKLLRVFIIAHGSINRKYKNKPSLASAVCHWGFIKKILEDYNIKNTSHAME